MNKLAVVVFSLGLMALPAYAGRFDEESGGSPGLASPSSVNALSTLDRTLGGTRLGTIHVFADTQPDAGALVWRDETGNGEDEVGDMDNLAAVFTSFITRPIGLELMISRLQLYLFLTDCNPSVRRPKCEEIGNALVCQGATIANVRRIRNWMQISDVRELLGSGRIPCNGAETPLSASGSYR